MRERWQRDGGRVIRRERVRERVRERSIYRSNYISLTTNIFYFFFVDFSSSPTFTFLYKVTFLCRQTMNVKF